MRWQLGFSALTSALAAIISVVLSAQDIVPSQLDSLERAAAGGDIAAQVQCALEYWWGIQRASDRNKACRCAQAAAEHDGLAAFMYTQCLAERHRFPGDLRRADSIAQQAVSALRVRAVQGDSYALVALAECYRRGLGGFVPRDDSVSVLLAEALRRGNALAAYQLSLTEPNSRRREELLERAAVGNVVAAMVELARQKLARGDTVRAVLLLRDADRRGSAEAALLLAGFASSGVGMPPSAPQSVRWLASAADRGNALAMLELGYRMLYGAGITADTASGLGWMLASVAAAPPQQREALVQYVATLLDSLPPVAHRLGNALAHHPVLRQQMVQLDSSKRAALLTGDGVRVWKAWFRPSVLASPLLLLRYDGHGAIAAGDALAEQQWMIVPPDTLVLWDREGRRAGRIELLTEGLAIITWSAVRALYSPLTLRQLREDRRLYRHELLRPTVEMLPPRVGERSVRLRLRARNVPPTGIVALPIGIARGRHAQRAEADARAQRLWCIWHDGDWEFLWEPDRQEIPEGWRGTCVLFVQCTWQYEGDDESMVVRSQPFELPPRLVR
ncbi:MAG: hypothetical protein KatS3mg038_3695 [Candidatus Kapaibacterium sp.]|nr:MAG: hypothetical protein KatS3mg038_3695 [Candidatus Kapabacteria bacterium]